MWNTPSFIIRGTMVIVNDVFVKGTAGKLSIDFEAAIDRILLSFSQKYIFLVRFSGIGMCFMN